MLLASTLALTLVGVSDLWGAEGESWDPRGRLPDYSYAGYSGGTRDIPYVPAVANVRDYGAVGDGVTDDTAAFQAALASMPPGALRVPRGRYVLRDVLHVERNGIVLRGEGSGPNGTVLSFPLALQDVTGQEHPWDYGLGGVIKLGRGALGQGHHALGPFRTNVVASAERGDRVITVANDAGLRRGDWIVLQLSDPGDGSLGSHLHDGQAAPGNCAWQPLPVRWPVQIAGRRNGHLLLAQPLRVDVSLAWSPKVYGYDPVRESGVEGLRIEFPPHATPPHLEERGYNGLTFEGALDCWARDVSVVNADNGASFNGITKRCTLQGVQFVAGLDGHHGVSFAAAADCMLEQFAVGPIFRHGITLDHQANGNVVRAGSGTDLNLDHHRDGSYENLFTDVHLGWGSAPFESGGSSCAGPQAAARNTYWNVTADAWSTLPLPSWIDIQTNLLPAAFTSTSEHGRWLEAVQDLQPVDLYASQLAWRLQR